ncbi:hypothetical protein COU77_02400 [Candidatus Peregrinibacteria bacterium CG10_big_fil_rev_8_21_14_0_10_49_16]|nr:MAG: hypothetical protein COW95_00885 [Candidatus Peregrinibacteria bacterium CG22_combo_CG10-13_8_21_14_all_49_11]PIR52061.1 MAG: hypothetical protein COU77_02400 [Candidatus Peregrinibacteria bacterium CG10_big_fil_rev_8_21_14_0_10_49_16]
MRRPFATLFFLYIGSVFFFLEAVLHALGLAVLEHDKIFLPTHDRYIALLALTNGALLILISTNITKYRHLFILLMIGIGLGMLNAFSIAQSGGYKAYFAVSTLDATLSVLGIGVFIWYIATWVAWYAKR